MNSFSINTRSQNLKRLRTEKFDLIIIGGGITGAGAARDAATRGMRVALLEARDFASGTSSKSSKLIHGGIRYLENLEFGLVFEALNERTKLFEMAPHLVHPLRFMLPLYADGRVGRFKMSLGMWLYDALSLFQAPQMHENLNANETVERMSDIKSKDLLGSFVYSDAYMDDDRLVLETLRSANELGAVCVNYTLAKGIQLNSQTGKVKSVICCDELTGEEFLIEGSHVISSVGPWTDQLGEKIISNWRKKLRPTKGIHLTFSKDRLPLTSAVVMAAGKSNRIVFGIPRHEMIIVGTTDTDFPHSPETVSTTAEDVDYLLKVANDYFPGAKLTKDDIISSYAGVRPLVFDGAESEGKTSREHTIFTEDIGVTFVAGGKYTTYRLMAEQVVDESLNSFPIEDRVKYKKGNTALPLNCFTSVEAFQQAMSLAPMWAKDFEVSLNDVLKLVERYGMEAEQILLEWSGQGGYWAWEAKQAIEHTMCFNLVDFYTRRTPLFLAEKDHGLSFLGDIKNAFANRLGWGLEEQQRQEAELLKFIKNELNWK